MFRHLFYALVTFAAWLITGAASIRWPDSALAKSFEAMTVLLALMLREALARSQSYFDDRRRSTDVQPEKQGAQ
jgi:hypothetical protein